MTSAFPIHNEADYERALDLIDALWDAQPGSGEAQVLDIMATLVDLYEKEKFRSSLPVAEPRDLIRFKLAELGLSQRQLASRLGWGTGRVSEILSGRRSLTLRMVQELSVVLGLPPGLLVHDHRHDEADHVWVRLTSAQTAKITTTGGLDPASIEPIVQRLIDQALGLLHGASTTTSASQSASPAAPQTANNNAYLAARQA